MNFRSNIPPRISFSDLRRLIGLCGLAAALSLSLAPPAAAQKDTLVIGLKDEAASLDPAKAYETTSFALVWEMYDNLVQANKDDFMKIEPELATSWEISADGKTWIFHLREGVRFASGNPLNADAVVFSLRRSLKLKNAASWVLSQLGLTEAAVTKIDDVTVQLILDKPYAPGVVLASLLTPIASIVEPQIVMAHEQNGDMGGAWLETHSAGSGRFVLTQCKRELPSEYVLTANPNYWGTPPVIPTLIVKGIQDAETQAAMLERGDVDAAWDLLPKQLQELSQNPQIDIQETLSVNFFYIAMNQQYAPLAKPEVRQAIRHALDYEGLVQQIWGGAALIHQTFIPKGLLGYNPATPYARDLPKAKELLQAAGYSDGFEVELTCLDYSPWMEIAMLVKANLADIGIRVTIKPMPMPQFMEDVWSPKRKFQLHLILWAFDYPDPDSVAKPFAHCTSLEDDAPMQALAWWSNYLTPETSQWVDQAAVEVDPQKRADLYHQATEKILADGPYAIFAQPLHQYAVRKDVLEFLEPMTISWQPFPRVK